MKFFYLALALVIVLSTACITIVRPGTTAPGGTTSGTQKPAAFIDHISPSSLNWGESVNFTGHGTAPSGNITAYLWRSSIDGNLGSRANFDTTQLSPGKHIVLFSVQDSAGNWSLETQGMVNVMAVAGAGPGTPASADPEQPPLDDPGTQPPADAGAPPVDAGVPPADAGVLPIDPVVPPIDAVVPPIDAIVPQVFQADLRITTGNPVVNPSTVAAGGNVRLSAWTVKNEGTAASGAFSNGFYLSTNQVISSSDTYLDGNSNVSLAAGAQHSWSGATLTIPATTAPGNYYIGILVDRANAVAESKETNNYVSSPLTVTAGAISRPDLRITTGNPTVFPSTVNAWSQVWLSDWTVKNEGTAPSGAFSNGFYLSTNQVISSSDTYLDGNSNVSLAAGAQHSWGVATLTIPAGTAPGNYYIGILVDRANAVVESAENNNYVSCPITVTAVAVSRPDLRITTGNPTLHPLTVVAGGNVTLSDWTIKNEGTAASGKFSNGFYLSNNQIITSSDTFLTDNYISPGLAAGAQYTWGGGALQIPHGTPPGNYYIGILVDRNNAVAESNEMNNYVSSPIKVIVIW